MADNKTRGTQLLRTDDSVPGVVKFYDRRQTDVAKAFVAEVSIIRMLGDSMQKAGMGEEDATEVLSTDGFTAVIRAAVHGVTQNILDASNKLEGDERVAFIRKACTIVQSGGWASAPVDEAKQRENVISGMMKLGFTREAALAALNAKK